MAKKPHPSVVELVDHLRNTGTGKAKLQVLLDLGCECDAGPEYLVKAAKLVPEGTMAKILDYVKRDHGPAPAETPAPPAPPAPKADETPKTEEPSDDVKEKKDKKDKK